MLPEVLGHRVERSLVLLPPFPRVLAQGATPAEHHLLRPVVEFDFDSHRVKVSPVAVYATPAARAAVFATSAAIGVRL
jgi:hypothetical protein